MENNVGKGEIARYEQFLLFPHCFQNTYAAEYEKNRAYSGKSSHEVLDFPLTCNQYPSYDNFNLTRSSKTKSCSENSSVTS